MDNTTVDGPFSRNEFFLSNEEKLESAADDPMTLDGSLSGMTERHIT